MNLEEDDPDFWVPPRRRARVKASLPNDTNHGAFMAHVRAGTDTNEVATELGLNSREASRLRRAVLKGE